MHLFLFQPGIWIGEGHIAFPTSESKTRFFTRWSVQEIGEAKIRCQQEVELHGLDQTTKNSLTLESVTDTHFHVTLENEMMGKVTGKGVIDPKTIAWELRDHPGVEGFEVYDLQDNGEYLFRAEYSSGDQYHTLIQGKIWRKV